MSDDHHLNKYLGWNNKQQSKNHSSFFLEVIQEDFSIYLMGRSGSYRRNGSGSPWWPGPEVIMNLFLKGCRRFTQGYPLPPTLSNVVVDAVIRHWLMVVVTTEAGTEVIGLLIRDFVAYLYADNGLVALTQPKRLQRASDVLAGLFNRAGLRTNTQNVVRNGLPSMPCAWQDVGGGVCEAGNRDRSNVLGVAEGAGIMSRVRSWGHGGVASDATSYP